MKSEPMVAPGPISARRHLGWYLPAALLFLLCVLFWRAALLHDRILIHGETIHFDLLMLLLQSQALEADPGILWNDKLYGGFPLFAEGQAAFAQPLKLALALLLGPASAMMAYHFLAMFGAALGTLLLGREIGLSRSAACFAGLGTGFSIVFVFFHNNMVCAGTLTWVPWVLLGVERWLRRPDIASVLWLALPATLLVLSGYPHFAHGVAIYIVCRVFVEACYRDGRAQARAQWRRLLLMGAAGVILAIGLAAVQLLPLAELVSESHRSEGIGLLYPSSLTMHVRGLLFSFIGHYSDPSAPNLQSLGSAFVSSLFLCGLVVCRDRRIVAHGIAALVLYNLGVQELSPLFRVVYEHSLVPGIHAFRFMWAYVAIFVVGASLVAGGALDALGGRAAQRGFARIEARVFGGGVLLLSAVAIGALVISYYHPEYGRTQLVMALMFAPACVLPLAMRRPAWTARFAVGLLILECVALRFDVFHFADRNILAEPRQMEAIRADRRAVDDYRVMDMTAASSFGYMPPDSPGLERGFRSMINSLTPMANLLWQLPSIDSVSSLGLHRRHLLYELTRNEFHEQTGTPGRRFIDVLGVRYVTAGSGMDLAHAQAIYGAPQDWSVYRNSHALPRFQLYSAARAFPTPEEAIAHWAERAVDELFIDSPGPGFSAGASGPGASTASLAVLRHTPSRSVVRVKSTSPVWLFMADANYPGWRVRIGGQLAPLFSAQVLGKAVEVPAGDNTVEFEFLPWSFRAGLVLSLLSMVAILVLLAVHLGGRRQSRSSCVNRLPPASPGQ